MIEPKIWKQKQTRRILFVFPWWECLDPILTEADVPAEVVEKRAFKIGSIVQIGWLLENRHGVWFGVNFTAQDAFVDISDTKQGKAFRSRRLKQSRSARKKALAKAVKEAKSSSEDT